MTLTRSALYCVDCAEEWILEIEDLSDFVGEQQQHVLARRYDQLITPREHVFPKDVALAAQVGIDRELSEGSCEG